MKKLSPFRTLTAIMLSLFSLIFTVKNSSAQSSNCANVDFELGDFTNWNGGTGTCCPITINLPGLVIPGSHEITNMTMVEDAGISACIGTPFTPTVACQPSNFGQPGFDPWAGFPIVCPNGGTYSARLGNACVGAHAEDLTYLYTVTPLNTSFTYSYACVLQDPGHIASQQPRFQISITDSLGNLIPCGVYQVAAGQGIPGFTSNNCNISYPIIWSDWTSVAVDLSSLIGQTLLIRFATGDCQPTGHFAYAYVDASCNSLQINAAFCPGSTQAILTAPGGYASYSWSPGGASTQSLTINNPVSGTVYTVTMTPFGGGGSCTSVLTFTLIASPGFTAAFSFTTGCGPTNVQFTDSTYTAPNGSLPTNWLWTFGDPSSGALDTSTAQNPTHSYSSTGTYTVTLIAYNGGGCADTITQAVFVPSGLDPGIPTVSNFNGNSISCFGANDGTATANPSGGTLPYTYSWSPSGGSAQTAINLGPGTYTVTITDSIGCTATATATLTEPTAMSATTGHTNSTCLGSNGKAWITVSGGTPGYTYSWSPFGGTGDTAYNLSQQVYTVTATDANGCTFTANVNVGGVTPTVVTSSHVDCNCHGDNTGSASVNVTGGNPPYTYTWTPAGTAGNVPNATGLSAGSYTVTIHNGNGCPDDVVNFTIGEPAQLAVTIVAENATCLVAQNGSIGAVPVVGGVQPYSYSWNTVPVQTTAIATGLLTGNYTVVITDAHGCTITDGGHVDFNPDYKVNAGHDTCIDLTHSGFLMATPDHIDAFTYSWSQSTPPPSTFDNPNVQNPTVTPGITTTYTVLVTDPAGCQASDSVEVCVVAYVFLPDAFSPNADDNNDFFHIINASVIDKADIKIFNRWGQLVFESTDPFFKWDGTFKGKPQEVDVYTWELTYTPANTPKIINDKGNVTLVR